MKKCIIITIVLLFALIAISNFFPKPTYSAKLCCDGYGTYNQIDGGNTCVKLDETYYSTTDLSDSNKNIICVSNSNKYCCESAVGTTKKYSRKDTCDASKDEISVNEAFCKNQGMDYTCYSYQKQPDNCETQSKKTEAIVKKNDNNTVEYITSSKSSFKVPQYEEKTIKDGELVYLNVDGCKFNVFAEDRIEIDVANRNNQSVFSSNMKIKEGRSFKAGTSVGMNITEYHMVFWNKENSENCKKTDVDEKIVEKVKSEFGSYLDKDKPKYSLILSDSNDINESNTTKIDDYESVACEDMSGPTKGIYYCSYKHVPKKICIDYKNSEVSYATSSCKSDEEEFSSDGDYWQYFIPINAVDNFSLVIADENTHYNLSQCKTIIMTNGKIYSNFVSYDNVNLVDFGMNSAFGQVKDGCYIRAKIDIPVDQYFYSVDKINDKSELTDFNLYFRKINADNPFPKPVKYGSSIWYDWYQEHYDSGTFDEKEKSFAKQSYAINLDAEKFNIINAIDKSYVSWDGISNDGMSDFVRDYFDETPDLNLASGEFKYSKLGCGIINSIPYIDDENEIKNPYYIERCAS